MRTKFAFISALFLLFVGQVVFAQVTGTVQDDYGPVADAEVTVRGGDASAVTDGNGRFSIDAKVGDVLTVTDAMGTEQDFSVTKNNMGTLKFGGAVELDIVTVVSVFDPSTKVESGASVVGSNQLEILAPSLSVDQMLSGKVSGLHSVAQAGGAPGGVANVVVRGSLSLNGGLKSPLYVVDGAYLSEQDVNSINPNDIESITVLKDASKLAVYGARGANGVVLIKTKRARLNQTNVSYRAMVGYSELMKLNNFDLMSSSQLLNFHDQLSHLTNPDGSSVGVGVVRSPEEIAALSQINTNWLDEFSKGGFQNSHHISINSGSDNSSTSFSIGYDQNNGNIVYYDGFERISATLGRNVKVSEKFRYGLNIAGAYTTRDLPRDRNNAQSPFYSILQNLPYTTVHQLDADGNTMYDIYGDPIFNQAVNGLGYAALDEMKYTWRQYRNFRIFGSAFASLELAKGLTATTTFGASYDRDQQESFGMPRSILAGLLETGGNKWDNGTDRFDYNWRNELTYARSWGDHNFSITGASEYVNNSLYGMYIESQGYPNNYQTVQSLGVIMPGSETSRWEYTRFGYLGSASYDFARKYFVDAYIRRDGSSLAGFNNQYGVFWGAAAGWDLAQENFLANTTWADKLRLNVSYGELGDDTPITRYSNFTAVTQDSWAGTGATANPGLYDDITGRWYLANPDLTWETNKKLNIGLEYGFLKRFTGKFDFFQDTRSDFIFAEKMAAEQGGFWRNVNAGELVNTGLEVELFYDVLKNTDGLNLTLYGNFTYINYEVTDLKGETQRPVAGSMIPSMHVVGEKPFLFNLVRYAGVNPDNGEALYYDFDGNITNFYDSQDAVPITDKSPLPDGYGGFGLDAKYKGFQLVADFGYQFGGYMYNLTYHNLVDIYPGTNNDNKHVDAANYWQNPGDTNVFQRPSADGILTSDQFLQKSDFIMFRSLVLGYDFDKKLLGNSPVKGLKLTAQVQNLALWTKYKGNPLVGTGSSESVNINSNGYVSGQFSLWNYPNSRAYVFGLNVSF